MSHKKGKKYSNRFLALMGTHESRDFAFSREFWLPNIQQQAEHLLHEYELDDKTLQKAQLKKHKIFQNYPTRSAPAAPSAPPPLAMDAKLKVLLTQDKMTLTMTFLRSFLTLKLTILFKMTMISL